MPSSIPCLPVLGFALAFAVFLLPGYAFVSWLHRRDAFPWPVRCAFGFAWSFVVFGVIGWPFLWYRGSFAEFLSFLVPLWGACTLLAVGLFLWSRRSARGEQDPPPDSLDVPPAPPQEPQAPTGLGAASLLAYLGMAGVAGYLWVSGTDGLVGVLFASPLLLLCGSIALRRWRRTCEPLLRFDAEDHRPAPRLWTALAVGFVLLQAVSAVAYSRPDWDDCYYLAAALDFQHAAVLNEQEPTHREGFPVFTLQSTLCFELWGAVLCHLTGLNPLVVFHSLIPGPLVLLCYAAYTALVREILPRRWVPLGLVGLSAVHLWGISSHETVVNFLLPRPWQGKTVLSHLAIPLVVVALMRFAHRPDWRMCLTLLATVGFGLVVSLSGLFLGVILVTCLGLVLAPRVRRRPLLVGVGLALLVLVGTGLAVRSGMEEWEKLVLGSRPFYMQHWLMAVTYYTRHGSAEIVWLLTLPLQAALLHDPHRRSYLIWFPLVLGLTFANPLLFHVVAAKVSSYSTYMRIWWLLPVAPGLAVLFALTVRFLARVLPRGNAMPLAAAGLLASFALPGLYVWSPRNSFIGPLGTPHLAETLEKMPADLKPIARRLADDPEIRSVRILCNEQVASFLTPYTRDFRFVQTRPLYTPGMLAVTGRPAEGLERHYLASLISSGRPPAKATAETWTNLRAHYGDEAFVRMFGPPAALQITDDAGTLLTRYHVKYVITAPGDRPTAVLPENGYEIILRRGAFILWQRRADHAPAPGSGSVPRSAARRPAALFSLSRRPAAGLNIRRGAGAL